MPYVIDGINGVFDTEELVELLKLENCNDICVIDIPSNINVSHQINSVRVLIGVWPENPIKNIASCYN